MQARPQKVKNVIPVQVGGMTIGIILGQADKAQAISRVTSSLARHGWFDGKSPRDLVRVGGAA